MGHAWRVDTPLTLPFYSYISKYSQAILDEGIFDGKMTSGEAQAAGQGVNQMSAQITALEGKLGEFNCLFFLYRPRFLSR